ncbi:Hvo_1808 family surface protein [Salinarchaeum laminariae]|uniref:Hvo_1808 family surface protein n=1 Tax=Salinarchaeum laminariae TaxID=869888 RepID=UPI0020BF8353|nr:Hvo_1808 family surface protein [Salinarchaeum laminariae]
MATGTVRVRRWTLLLLAIGAVALLAGGAIAAPSAGASSQDEVEPLVEPCAAEMPENYADASGGTTGTIGFVDGVWYDEPLDVTTSDGLTDEELKQVAARTAARVEALRCLPFEEGLPPIEVLNNEEFAERTGDQFANVSEAASRSTNAQFETMLVVPDEESGVGVIEQTQANGTLGQYFIEEDRIVLVRPEGSTTPIRESTLFQELGHALQDQQFNLSQSGPMTSDEQNAWLGVIEGDMNWLEHRFVQRCDAGRWAQSCIEPEEEAGGGGDASDPPSWGVTFERGFPYYEGPPFVQQLYQETGGWDAVNALYDDIPETSVTIIDPKAAEGIEFVDPEIGVEPEGDWEQLEIPNSSNTDEVGPAWIASMFMAPSLESGGEVNVVEPTAIYNYNPDGTVAEVGPVSYQQAPAMGWRGDTMAVYASGEATTTVWTTAWADDGEAEEFADAYVDLLDVREASETADDANVYAFESSSEYEGSVAVVTEGDRVTIVSGPSTDALTTVAPELAIDATGSDGGADGNGSNGSDDGSDDSLPGFGVAVGLVALLTGGALAARSSR